MVISRGRVNINHVASKVERRCCGQGHEAETEYTDRLFHTSEMSLEARASDQRWMKRLDMILEERLGDIRLASFPAVQTNLKQQS